MAAETPADTIRRAAALMRQRAEAAPPGPWHVELLGAKGYPQRISNARATVIGQTYTSPIYPPAGAEHIASWHPIVAHAVADWLDEIGKDHPAKWYDNECPSCGSAPCGPHPDTLRCVNCGDDYPCYSAADALKVARAYLGEVSGA